MVEIDTGAEADFYRDLPPLAAFASLADPSVYAPVPAGWVLGLADIVDSTGAISAGRYKEVNTAAAAVIAAVTNALPQRQIPFVFGGDGASFALAPGDAAVGEAALSATVGWIAENFGLQMRAAMVPVAAIRAQGVDLRLARFEVSTGLSYAMFSGGGIAFAEARMKAGEFSARPAPSGQRPDLTGLSCRFSDIAARNGVIHSLIVVPAANASPAAFGGIVRDLLAIVDAEVDGGRPVPALGLPLSFNLGGYLSETKTAAARSGRSRWTSAVAVLVRTSLSKLIFASGQKVGSFQPQRYLRELSLNSDFRKFDDGLRMTLDCTPATADRIEALLAEAARSGTIAFGCHRQTGALITCFVPSATRSDHVHFVDGASGGYAMAAQALKASLPVQASGPA